MIQMRWLDKRVNSNDAMPPVLQYRYDKSVEHNSFGIMAMISGPQWSEWEDVPVERPKGDEQT